MTIPDAALVVGAGESPGAALAQSAACEFGRRGSHLAHVVVDGPIKTPFVRERFPELVASRPADALLDPEDIAHTYWAIHRHNRSAWTFEGDLRPWVEPLPTFQEARC